MQLPLNLLNGGLTLFGALIVINHKNINLKILKSTSTFGKVGAGEPQNKLMCQCLFSSSQAAFLIRGRLSYASERSEHDIGLVAHLLSA